MLQEHSTTSLFAQLMGWVFTVEVSPGERERERERERVRERERERERESKLVFYAQSIITVLSQREKERTTNKQTNKQKTPFLLFKSISNYDDTR